MPKYRRILAEGATYFFTANLENRRSDLLTREINSLRRAYRYIQQKKPFRTDAICVLPDHIHCIWTLPPGDSDYASRWMLLKSHFSRSINSVEPASGSKRKRGERGIWQRRFWEHLIRDDRDFENHIGYIWNNPVKHGYSSTAEDWEYTSLHRDLVHFASLTAPYKDPIRTGERV